MPRYGDAAAASAVPVSVSVETQGSRGVAACRDSSAQGGERNAEDVTAQTRIAARSSTGLARMNGSAMNASPDSTLTASIHGPRRAIVWRTRSTQKPVATSTRANTI